MSMQALLAASQSMVRMQTMKSAQTQMQGTANVLRIESQLDGGNKEKESKADALEQSSSNLMNDLMNQVTDLNETLKPDEEAKTEENQEQTGTENGSQRDTVTFSDVAEGYRGDLPKVHPAVDEAVTYDAGGSKAPSAPVKATPTFEATA